MNTYHYKNLKELVSFFRENEVPGRLIKIKVKRAEGVEGVYDALKIMDAMVAQYKTDLWLRQIVLKKVGPLSGGVKNIDEKIGRLFVELKKTVPYVKDIWLLETIQSPRLTIKNGGDCDCLSLLAASMLQSVGISTSWVLAGSSATHLSHVYVYVPLVKRFFDLTVKRYGEDRPYAYKKIQ